MACWRASARAKKGPSRRSTSAKAEAQLHTVCSVSSTAMCSPSIVPPDGGEYHIYNCSIKQALVHLGFPAEDLAGYVDGEALPIQLRSVTESGRDFSLRDYQQTAVDLFYDRGSSRGGSGVIVLPCGSGKTVVGIGVMAQLGCQTLILCPNTVAVRQWIAELLDKTTLTPDLIGEYTGEKKEIRPVTIATYQILTYRPSRVDAETGEVTEFPHFSLFDERNWGLILYDEVHLLPAPVFRITAEIQARRRLGLTATLVREDGRETDVFSLIGPKKYDVPWKDLEKQGWIIAAENPLKMDLLEELLRRHSNDCVLVIGQYIEQLKEISKKFDAPLVTGKT